MIRRLVLVVALLSSCTDDASDTSACGEKPTRPGYAVAFENGKAILDASQWNAFVAWADATQEWMSCAGADR